jgi:hypothetical protein
VHAIPSGCAAPTAAAGCATLPPSRPTPTRTAQPPATELPSSGTPLEPGRYTNSNFEPAVTFEVREGWIAQQVAPGFFDIQDVPGSPDVVAVQFANVADTDTAGDALQEVQRQPNLLVGDIEKLQIAGETALRVIVETTDPSDSDPPMFRHVLTTPAGPISIASGRRLQVTFLDVEGGVLAILVGGSIAEWEHALELATPVIDSITIGD